jgi:hypothetical protein
MKFRADALLLASAVGRARNLPINFQGTYGVENEIFGGDRGATVQERRIRRFE